MSTRQTGIKEGEDRAGAAVGAGSRLPDDPPSAPAATGEEVKAVIAEPGGRPDASAPSPRKKSTRTIGVVIPDIRNPFFAELMQHIEYEAKALGLSVLFLTSNEDSEAERRHLADLARRKVEGVILLPSVATETIERRDGLNLVIVDRPLAGAPVIAADHRGGAKLAVDYLRSLGHRRIACIAGPQGTATSRARLAGFVAGMAPIFAADSIALDDCLAFGGFDYVSGQTAADELLNRRRQAPTAIFACSDQQAIGALRLAADRGLKVPRDLSVVGFDGILLADLVSPRLTTVQQPVGDIAKAAVAALFAPQLEPLRLFPCQLIERDSAGPPPESPLLRPRTDPARRGG